MDAAMDADQGAEDSSLRTDLHVEATYRLTEALVEAEDRMRRRVELLTEIVFELDAGGRLVFLNPAWPTALGMPAQACLGRPLSDFIDESDGPVPERILAHPGILAAGRRPLVRMRRADGTTGWMELSMAPIPGGGAVGALHDVTARKLAEDELAKLSLVASYTDNLVVITDREGRIEWVNPAFSAKTGWTLPEILGRTPGDVLQGPDTDPRSVRQIGRRLRDGHSFDAEVLNYTRRGEPYWVQFHINPVRGADGDIERFISIQSDSTELRRTQRELQAAKEQAETASEAKTQFLATISHEMRTPLNAILGSSDLAMEDGVDAPVLRSHLERINDSAESLRRLISDLLDVSKIEAGQIDIERIPMDLRACLRSATAPLADRARAKGLDFGLMVDESLPAVVLGDPERLRQIVANLAENAVKFTDAGSVRVEVAQATDAAGGGLLLELGVRDTGPGIAHDAQRRIFDRFEQGDGSTTRRKGGAGLGLNIVRSLVDALSGSVQVHSTPGQGATFRVVLPLIAVTDLPTPRGIDRERDARLSARTGEAPRILVAEDNDANFQVLEIYLAKAGYRVERARDGREAVAAAANSDLILMDVEMPGMDGLEATRRIRAIEQVRGLPPVPVVALTAHALQEFRQRCLAAGCTGYLSKPVRMPTLLETVAAFLDGRGQPHVAAASATAADDGHDLGPLAKIDPGFLVLVPGYLDDCRRDGAMIRDAVAQGAWQEVIRTGHTLKGSGPTLGFDEVGRYGQEIELGGRTADAARVLRGVDGLVFVADSQKDRLQENIDSLENLKQNLAEYGYRLQTGPSDFEGITWVIQYNKRDMPQVSELEDMQVAMNPNRVPHFEAVAVNGNGVKDTLKGISSLVIKKLNADPTGVGGTAEPKKESKPVAAAATPSSKAPVAEDYSAMNEDDLAKELAEEPKSKSAAAASSTPAMSRPKPAAPAPVAEAPAAHAGMPVLNVVQKGGARVRGLGFGSSNLTLANMAGGDADLYQLTGKVSFLGIFGSTWSRRLRFTGTEEKAYGGVVSKFFKFLSDDGTDPSLEVYVKDDFDKPLFVNYLGKFGEVKIVPPGKAPLA